MKSRNCHAWLICYKAVTNSEVGFKGGGGGGGLKLDLVVGLLVAVSLTFISLC